MKKEMEAAPARGVFSAFPGNRPHILDCPALYNAPSYKSQLTNINRLIRNIISK